MLATLRRIVQEVSAAKDLTQALDTIVRRVREALHVDACSVYLVDHQSNELLLMATEGLRPESVGTVRLPASRGLVGLVYERQEPLNLPDGASHPRYHYFPQKGEEHLKSFLGVPLIRFGQVTGVVTVQDRQQRPFRDEDLDFLVTVAAQLAGALNQPMALDWSARLHRRGSQQKPYWEGVPGAPGVAIGTVTSPFPLARLSSVPHRAAEDVAMEIRLFQEAVGRVRARLKDSRVALADALAGDQSEILDAYALILDGETLSRSVIEGIEEGNWGPGALRVAVEDLAGRFEQMVDPYLAARGEDIRTLGSWILTELNDQPLGFVNIPEQCVLVGDDVGLGLIAEVPIERLAGIVCTQGSALSHTAIVARTLGVPAIMGLGGLSLARLEGREVVIDGYQGRIYPEPSPAVRAEFERLANEERELSSELTELRSLPATTPDGVSLPLHVKAGLPADVVLALRSGAEGVGLYRTEVGFMVRTSFPSEDEQCLAYQEVLKSFSPRPVVMRTLDVGGDKKLPYFPIHESNPFLGWRGIRLTLDHPDIFLAQLRAMLRADVGFGNLQILLPMVTTLGEVDEALRLIDRARVELMAEGLTAGRRPPLGVMVETPAAVALAGKLAARVDFLSIGSNDLTQYVLAVDRDNRNVARLYDSLHPVMLECFQSVVRAGHLKGKPVSVCGEMTDDPLAAVLLLGMDVDSLATTAASLSRIKAVIRSVDHASAKALLELALEMENPQDVRDLVGKKLEDAGLGGIIRPGRY